MYHTLSPKAGLKRQHCIEQLFLNVPGGSVVLRTQILMAFFVFTSNLSFAHSPASQGQKPLKASPRASINDFAWIAGQWEGRAMGGTFESSWNRPSANSMLGMFKFMKDEKVVFYELLTIVQEPEGIVLRLKHFDAKLVGWETKEESIEFPFISASPKELKFDGIQFVKATEHSIHVSVTIDDAGETRQLDFTYESVKSGNEDSSL